MGNHVLRPVWLVLGILVSFLIIRHFLVPPDFGVQERGFMYGYHRKSNEGEWKALKAKYKTRKYCKECHTDEYESIMSSKHRIIQCENCHGPAMDHPKKPDKLPINRKRSLCIRCHAHLPYPTSQRAEIKGIDPEKHNPGQECIECHDPHGPDLEE